MCAVASRGWPVRLLTEAFQDLRLNIAASIKGFQHAYAIVARQARALLLQVAFFIRIGFAFTEANRRLVEHEFADICAASNRFEGADRAE